MKNLINKQETARYLKVSLPTLNKFLRKNKELIIQNKVSFKKLNNWILKNINGAKKCS